MLRPKDQFHVGIVVDDLAAALEPLSSLFGYRWCAPTGGEVEVDLPTGAAVLEMMCTYSTTAPRLELVRGIPGTLWEPVPGSAIHHVGYWSDDVAGDTAALQDGGYVVEATRKSPGGGLFFAFLRSPTGPRTELVTRAAQPSLERYWAQHEPRDSSGGTA
jgi:Glyoxalase/Bleomycin resistance protein/Dioxygenase superfamily